MDRFPCTGRDSLRGSGWKSKVAALLGFVSSVVVVAPACGDSSAASGPACMVNNDCAYPLVCVLQQCHDQCATSIDCMGARCIVASGTAGDAGGYVVCELPIAGETTCNADAPCEGDLVCGVDGQCRMPCSASMPSCLPGQECASAVGVTACFDPKLPSDKAALVDAQVLDGAPDAGPDTDPGDAG